MARRKPKAQRDHTAFSEEETQVVYRSLAKLYRRSVHHLIHPIHPRDWMPDVWRSFVHEETWKHLADARQMMLLPTNAYAFFGFRDSELVLDFGDTPATADGVTMQVTSALMLPDRTSALVHRTGALIPSKIVNFCRAVDAERKEWISVMEHFNTLNKSSTRLTAAYHWPCAAALMTMGGRPANDLGNCTRPGTIGGELACALREANSLVMNRMILPEIDNREGASYEGDDTTGLAVRLVFNQAYGILGDTLWPLTDAC